MSAAEDWAAIEEIFFRALQLPPEQRERWIDEAAADPRLAGEVRSLVRAHELGEAEGFPRRVGPYRLERLVGRGGMGEVWLATRADGQFEQRVALKFVRAGIGSAALAPRFRQERQMLASLNHPNITKLLDGGISPDGRSYLVMEWVEGEPLLDFCEKRGMDLRARLALFRTLCSAVEHAHQNLVVHRDIKPANVLVTADGSPKLLDFGIAKLTDTDGAATATAMPLMTLRYASPEQVRGAPSTTGGDVYSLGVTLFELLTGEAPYPVADETLPAMVTAITSGEVRRASSVKRDGARRVPPGDLDAILAMALDRDPRRRYPSVERLSADIGNYLEGAPVSARAPTAAYRFRLYARKHWIGLTAASAVALCLAGASLVSVRAARIADQQRQRAERMASFLEDSLNPADPDWGGPRRRQGAPVPLADVLDDASRRVPTEFPGDPAAQARLHAVLARIYTHLQDFPKAEVQVKAGLSELPSLDKDPTAKAQLLVAAGTLDFLLSRSPQAIQELRQAIVLQESTPALRADIPARSLALSGLACALAEVRQVNESKQAAQRALDLMRSMPAPPLLDMGRLHYSLTVAYMKTGELERAREEGRAAVDELSRISPPPKALGDVSMYLGICDRYLGNPAGAVFAFQRSVATAQRVLGADDPQTVAPRIELAYQRALGGETAGAVVDLRACLQQARRAASAEDLFHALHSLGYVLTLAGKPAEGEPLLREAVRVGGSFLGPGGPSMGQCDLELGECLERLGKRAEAQDLYRKAHSNFLNYFGDIYATRQVEAKLHPVITGQ
jgi:serine/threonine-protein kinase